MLECTQDAFDRNLPAGELPHRCHARQICSRFQRTASAAKPPRALLLLPAGVLPRTSPSQAEYPDRNKPEAQPVWEARKAEGSLKESSITPCGFPKPHVVTTQL